MKNKNISGLLILSLMFIYSCKKEFEPQDSSGTTIPSTTENAASSSVLNPGATALPTQNLQEGQQVVSQNTLAGMNPPHGQAGHRCDIAVGAPLNSIPGKATSKSETVVTNQVPNIEPPQVVTKPGMNPPHGQEGHRCDIAVGAPLNSPKAPAPDPTSQTPAILNLDTIKAVPKP